MSQQINLFNPVFMKQRKYFSAITMLQALALIVLGAALFYGYAVYHVRSMTLQFNEISKRYVEEQGKLQRYTAELSPQDAQQQLEAELKSTEVKLEAQQKLVDTLKSGAIGNTAGYSEYMRAFARQAVSGLWLTGFNIAGDATQISISGSVLSPELLPVYIRRLNKEEVMRGKSFASLQMRRGGDRDGAVEFTLRSDEAGGAAN